MFILFLNLDAYFTSLLKFKCVISGGCWFVSFCFVKNGGSFWPRQSTSTLNLTAHLKCRIGKNS